MSDVVPFEIQRIIGRGAQGTVYLATQIDPNKGKKVLVAIKCVLLSADQSEQKIQIEKLNETLNPLKSLSHPNILKHFFNQYEENHLPQIGPYRIIMEYCSGGTLHDTIKLKKPQIPQIQNWAKQILEGLAYLYEQQIVHRDIKTQNIYFLNHHHDSCPLKIGDFGDIKRIMNNSTSPNEVSHGKGTCNFMSPEMIEGNRNPKINIGRKTDIWSFGCVVLEMATGSPPRFIKPGSSKPLATDMAILYYVGNGGLPHVPPDLPEVLLRFLDLRFQREPAHRALASELLQDMFTTVTVSENFTTANNLNVAAVMSSS